MREVLRDLHEAYLILKRTRAMSYHSGETELVKDIDKCLAILDKNPKIISYKEKFLAQVIRDHENNTFLSKEDL